MNVLKHWQTWVTVILGGVIYGTFIEAYGDWGYLFGIPPIVWLGSISGLFLAFKDEL